VVRCEIKKTESRKNYKKVWFDLWAEVLASL
jgi:hypothetical protein